MIVPSSEPLAIAVRAYVPTGSAPRRRKGGGIKRTAGPSEYVFVFDTETAIDAAQQLRFGTYQLRKDGALDEAGFFYDPVSLTEAEAQRLCEFAARHGLRVLTVREVVEEVFYGISYELGATIVGFNLPWDLSRLALAHASARGKRMRGGFTFRLSDDPRWPRVQVKHLSTRAALIRFAATRGQHKGRGSRRRGDTVPVRRGFFVDLKSLAAALTSRSFSLAELAGFLAVPSRKLATDKHGGPLTEQYLAYAVRDVQTTWECFVALCERYAAHNLARTSVHRILSEAGLGKAYLREMGVRPWREVQPDFPPDLTGTIMRTYYGGRSEVRLRRVIREVSYCDFLSMYPTVCTLMGLWRFVIARGMTWRDATDEVRTLLDELTLTGIQRPATWRELAVLVQVMPAADLFPVRTKYPGEAHYTIGLNHLTSKAPLWFTLADCLAHKVLTGRSLKILRAIRFIPGRKQAGLAPIAIAGNPAYVVDPVTADFYRRLIDRRTEVKREMAGAEGAERDRLDTEQLALKILANATSYGIFVELNINETLRPEKATCYGTDESFPVSIDQSEEPGRYFHPLLATLITGAARLMLAIAERLVLDAGLNWVFCDTDSMTIAKPDGMAKTEFHARVEAIRQWFTPLNPYAEKGPLLKLEEANYGRGADGKLSGKRQPLYCFAISAKRYALFNLDPAGRPILRKASAHGLGHLMPPYGEAEAPASIPAPLASRKDLGVDRWQHDVWYRIVSAALSGRPAQVRLDDFPGFGKPAVSRYAATTPHLLRWFRRFNRSKPYREQVRPFGFLLAFQSKGTADWQGIDLGRASAAGAKPARVASRSAPRSWLHVPRAVAPFDRNLRTAATRAFDRETGEPVPLNRLKSYRHALARYHLHPEAKFLGGDYTDCGPTRRRHIGAVAVHPIGKEANRWEEQFHLGADPEAQSEYGTGPEGRERILAAIREAVKAHGGQTLARKAGLSRQHLAMILAGRRHLANAVLAKLAAAAATLNAAQQHRDSEAQATLAVVHGECRRLGLRRFARKAGIDDGFLARLLAGSRRPSSATLARLRGAVAGSAPATGAAITRGEPGDHPQRLG